MMTTNFGRDFTHETACRIYHPADSIVNQSGLIFAVIDVRLRSLVFARRPTYPTKLLGVTRPILRGAGSDLSSSGPCQLRRAGGSGSRRAIHKPSLTLMAGRACFFVHLGGAGVVSVYDP